MDVVKDAGTTIPAMPRGHVHLAVWFLLLVHSLIGRLAPHDLTEWPAMAASTNLMLLMAFLAIFHLLTDRADTAPARRGDYVLLVLTVLAVAAGGVFGSIYDIPLIMAALALYYFSRHARIRDARSVGLVYMALFINGFAAPLIFMFYKDIFLIGEVDLAVRLNALIGIEISGTGTRISGESGLNLRMIGACSVFSNISYAFLGFASVKAFFRLPLKAGDAGILLLLSFLLMVVNSLRLGLMTPGWSAYEFWHHGDGAILISVLQMALICVVSLGAVTRTGLPWRA